MTITSLTDLIIHAARRPGGMVTSDITSHSISSISSGCNRLTVSGRIFRAHINPRSVRFFGTAQEAVEFERAMARSAVLAQTVETASKRTITASIDMSRARITVGKSPSAALFFGQALAFRLPSDLPFVPRVGSMEFEAHPSRFGSELRYRDGRVEQLAEGATA